MKGKHVKAGRVSAVCAAIGAALSAPGAMAQDEQSAGVIENIIVTGYRQSLATALDLKKNSTGVVDSIFADDIADFPDLNLAESMQRIPGIAVTRDSGEGRQITVRGLSGEFTRVRINGMEAMAATGGEGGPNRGRSFDFNVFASELFNSLQVRKTASANVDEGSLGAVVDLNTGRPLDYGEGMTFVANMQGQYNNLVEDFGPRFAGLFSYVAPGETWGVSLSAAWSESVTSEFGHNTVRWQTASFASVRGVDCAANPGDAGCATVASGFHPRIPRYGEIRLERERLGLTGGLQFRPTDRTTVSFDVLYSELDASRGEKWLEVLFRGNEGGMDVVDFTHDPATNNLTSMTVNNAWVRNENFKKAWTTEFNQVGLRLDHEISDGLRLGVLVGTSESDLTFPYEITFMYDDRDYNGFRYDYTDDRNPVLAYEGPDVADPANFQLTELRDRPSRAKHGFDNAELNLEWDFADSYTLEGGVSYKKFEFGSTEALRDTGVCGAGLHDCDLDDDGIDDLVGVPATAALSEIYRYDDDVAGSSTAVWAIPSLSGWIDYFDLFNLPAQPNLGNTNAVTEENLGVYLQLNGDIMLGDMPFRFDIGVRYVETDQSSTGFNSGTEVTIDRDPYDDTLPAMNAALFVTDELVLRASAAKVLTRPGLASLTPGGSVDSFNYRVSYQNPFLEPTRADAFDASIEWYFADESLLSLALFYKDIESRPISTERQGTYASTGLPTQLLVPTSPAANNPEGGPAESCNPANGGSGCWTIRSVENGPGGSLEGFEIGIQMPFAQIFDRLPPVLDSMGFIANYTYVDSEVDYTFGNEIVTERLFGLSNNSYNATVYYENETFAARLSAAYRDDYIDGTSGTGNRFEGFDGTFNLDFHASYVLNDNFEISFEALNLTDDYQDRWVDIETRRRYEYDHTGRVFLLGVKYRL
ncbi:MAG TPA: TonB-dependent receptor [Woeseiaceae bacterium]|nr:TonB-dependent receptor [Woeseiaceae bacterium]